MSGRWRWCRRLVERGRALPNSLRALGILLALFQDAAAPEPRVSLMGLEEPEMALHPAATGVLLSALREASHHTQILVTSHSPDLLDDSDIATESILAVEHQGGVTYIAPVDDAGRSICCAASGLVPAGGKSQTRWLCFSGKCGCRPRPGMLN